MVKTILVIGGSILQVPLVEQAQSMGFDVICSDRDPECPCRELADRFWEIDVFDSAEHVEHARILLKQESVQIVGCIAAGIDAILTTWEVNLWIHEQTKEKHGFWSSAEATYTCRLKQEFRTHQMKNGFPHPDGFFVNADQPPLYSKWDPERFIIKSQDNSGGRGSQKFGRRPDFKEYNKAVKYAISKSRTGRAIAEELLIGKEYTVETIWEDGKMYPAFITDRFFKNNDKYAIEAGASHPTQLTNTMQKAIYSEMERLGESLGMKFGPLKGDILITNKGNFKEFVDKIYILEATTRYSGGMDCQYLVPFATGKNILKAAIQSSVYGKFDKELLKAKWDKYSMIGSPWPKEGIVKSIELFKNKPKKMEKYMRGGEGWIHIMVRRGDKVKYVDSTSRVAFLIVCRDTRVEAIQAMKEGLENIKIITE